MLRSSPLRNMLSTAGSVTVSKFNPLHKKLIRKNGSTWSPFAHMQLVDTLKRPATCLIKWLSETSRGTHLSHAMPSWVILQRKKGFGLFQMEEEGVELGWFRLASIIVNMYSKCGNVVTAQKLLDKTTIHMTWFRGIRKLPAMFIVVFWQRQWISFAKYTR